MRACAAETPFGTRGLLYGLAALPLSLVSTNRKERDPWEYLVTYITNAFEFTSASMVEFDGIE